MIYNITMKRNYVLTKFIAQDFILMSVEDSELSTFASTIKSVN